MYFYLISSLKRRLILELQDSFSRHPVYEKIVPFIQNKFAFDERPQYGIVVKGSSGNKVQVSAQNYLGSIESHVMLAYYNEPAYLLEWVREDLNVVRENGDSMPIPAGVYYIECLSAPTSPGEFGEFIIDPLLTITDEPVIQIQEGPVVLANLQNQPVQGTLRLWTNRNLLLVEGSDYTIDYETRELHFLTGFFPGSLITADYRYAAPSIGPIKWSWNTADWTTLPGVVLAFGKRGRVGDKQAVVIYSDRVETAQAYGGRFDASFDLDVISRDPIQVEEIADLVFMYLWAEKRSALSFEGIELTDTSMGGEAEETYDEAAELFYYNYSMTVAIQSDWEMHLPLPFTVSRASAYTKPDGASSIQALSQASLFFNTTPVIVGRNASYERIG
jgi:hypothetical protein